MKNLYVIRDIVGRGYAVILIRTNKPVYFGSRADCVAWISVNGHDEWN